MAEITIRFVPRSATSATFESFAEAPSDMQARAIRPNRATARKALSEMSAAQVSGEKTAQDRISATMSRAQFNEMFGAVELQTQATSKSARAGSITMNESYDRPMQHLEIPDRLKNTIAFAYVPRPVEYFAPTPLPPSEDLYYLRLSDVQLGLNVPRCHRYGWTGRGTKVAMADSGFYVHPWFIRSGARLLPTESPGSGPADIDTSGHGTGEAANIFAVAPDCTVFGVKHGPSAASTLETCIDQSPDVMTNSWGFDIDDQSRAQLQSTDPQMYFELLDIESVLNEAVDQNIAVLFSAGNGHLAFPASFPGVLAVGGVTLNEDATIEASNYASAFQSQLYPGRNVPDFCGFVGRSEAPPQSAHIMLPVPDGSNLDGTNFPSGASGLGWGIFSGTSAACPQVAGVTALLKQINRNLTPEQIRNVLAARAIDVTRGRTATGVQAATGPDLATGAGLVDALRACGYASPTS